MITNIRFSDDDAADEEEDTFLGFTNAGGKLLGDADEQDDQMNSDDDEERALTGHGVSGASSALPHYSRQKLPDLRNRYTHMFHELDHGAVRMNALSPKLRRTATGGAVDSTSTEPQSYRERILTQCQQTKSVGEFVKIAYPELADPNIETERKDLLLNQESMR